jgi:serine/threonine-protein kinase
VLPFTGLHDPGSVAVDSTGTVYVTDGDNNRVLKLAAGSSVKEVLPFTGLHDPGSVAVDSTGTVYVTDTRNNRVLKLGSGSSTPEVLPFTGLHLPHGVAVDSTGTVYVIDASPDSVFPSPWPPTMPCRVLTLAAGSSTQTVLPFTDLKGVYGLAVDSTGSVYVTDVNSNRVLKLPVQ